MAASRVYLGVHYPSDVTASFLGSEAGIVLLTGLWNLHAARLLARIGFLRSFGPVPAPENSHAAGRGR